mmetsp:Transcript_57301/g.133603  ORF Transcript_57301/g.133603 Transcript_57301/m.133603 type:complete len:375 (+) Transcript_57301:158-1282(+)
MAKACSRHPTAKADAAVGPAAMATAKPCSRPWPTTATVMAVIPWEGHSRVRALATATATQPLATMAVEACSKEPGGTSVTTATLVVTCSSRGTGAAWATTAARAPSAAWARATATVEAMAVWDSRSSSNSTSSSLSSSGSSRCRARAKRATGSSKCRAKATTAALGIQAKTAALVFQVRATCSSRARSGAFKAEAIAAETGIRARATRTTTEMAMKMLATTHRVARARAKAAAAACAKAAATTGKSRRLPGCRTQVLGTMTATTATGTTTVATKIGRRTTGAEVAAKAKMLGAGDRRKAAREEEAEALARVVAARAPARIATAMTRKTGRRWAVHVRLRESPRAHCRWGLWRSRPADPRVEGRQALAGAVARRD